METRVDHELEMIPKGPLALMAPMMRRLARRNLETTADALKRHLEHRDEGPVARFPEPYGPVTPVTPVTPVGPVTPVVPVGPVGEGDIPGRH